VAVIDCDVLVIGAGAAGLFAAFSAGQRGRRVQVIDHANKVGKKILMSGGGRCNFTNTGTSPANYLSANPHFCKSALARYTPSDFIALVNKHKIAFHEKELGQLFCDSSSKAIVRLLLDECAAAGVQVRTDTTVEAIETIADGWQLRTSGGVFTARWWWPPAGCRCRPWAPPALATRLPASSGMPCSPPVQDWCR
jgi:predicted Rossmann fold flavoprotein